jgi:hypothetical protein
MRPGAGELPDGIQHCGPPIVSIDEVTPATMFPPTGAKSMTGDVCRQNPFLDLHSTLMAVRAPGRYSDCSA